MNRIHPTAVIAADVELGTGNVIGPFAVLLGPCRIGDGNWIAPHVCIGGPAEVRGGPHPVGWGSEPTVHGVEIGDRNVIREFVTVNGGSEITTVIGSDCYIMSGSHVAHDCVLEDWVTITSAVRLAGHCRIWTRSNLGMGTVVHQRTEIGPGAMIGMQSMVRRDVDAFSLTFGVPARRMGINTVGLQRWGCDDATIAALARYLAGDGERPSGLPAPVADALDRWSARYSYSYSEALGG
jgi:UDP-N-acetylglucosamine acyltransferase